MWTEDIEKLDRVENLLEIDEEQTDLNELEIFKVPV